MAEDQELHRILQVVLAIYLTIESKGETTLSAKEFIHKFNETAKTNYVIASDVDVSDSNKIIDELNWLNTYCKNRYSIDLITNSPFANANSEISTTDEKKGDDPEKFGGIMNFINENQDKLNDLYVTSIAANKNFQNDVKSGKIYLNETKPKIIPIIKKIFTFSSFLLGVLFIGYIISRLIGYIKMGYTSADWVGFGLLVLIYSMWAYLSIFSANRLLKSWTKDNKNNLTEYYLFDNIYSILWFYILMIATFICTSFQLDNSNAASFIVADWISSGSTITTFCFVLWIAIAFVIVVNTALLVAGLINNPHRDSERVGKLAKKYYEEVNNLGKSSETMGETNTKVD
ncbi:MAG: hypothetical protein LBV22_03375 [Mycoplasmataceae bacterium]|nr:hypothetical protein [Mycoplasmataceae bacterium]